MTLLIIKMGVLFKFIIKMGVLLKFKMGVLFKLVLPKNLPCMYFFTFFRCRDEFLRG
jgi:hypothetical protein